jgi:hypothetical protein
MARPPQIAFRCPSCNGEAECGLSGLGRCACGATPSLTLSASIREQQVVDACPACGATQLYVQRDFNQKAGLGVVIVGAVLAPFTHYASLVVAALIDTALYLMLAEIAICYRCKAHFRGFTRNPRHEPFDLHLAEQYDKPAS